MTVSSLVTLESQAQFSGLLIQSIDQALEFRVFLLEQEARRFQVELESAKLSAAGLGLVGLILSANPLFQILAALGAVGYGWVLFRDHQVTKQFCPLPCLRRSPLKLLEGAGLPEEQEGLSPDPLEDVLTFLPPELAHEYELLAVAGDRVGSYLARIEPGKRLAGYRYLLRQTRLRNTLHLPEFSAVQEAVSFVTPLEAVAPVAPVAPVEPDTTAVSLPQGGDRVQGEGEAWREPVQRRAHPSLEGVPSERVPVVAATPVLHECRTVAPDLGLELHPRERMQGLLKAMAESGFPLGTLLNQPFVWCWGRSQSGKTTVAVLLAIARMAMGHRVGYLTTDRDYPRQLPWVRVEDSPEGYAVALDEVTQLISQADKHALVGQGWVVDEMFAAFTQYQIAIQPLLTTVLMKGAKTKIGIVGISQADTSSAHGLKGIDAAWREERVSIQAIHAEDALGDRCPTGRYGVDRNGATEEWSIPGWMLTECNSYGAPDPVLWVAQRFPELWVQDQNDRGARLNPTVHPVQALNHSDHKAVQVSGATVQRFVNQQFSREEAQTKIAELGQAGLNQTQIIQVLWGAKKGGSAAYQQALTEYKQLTSG